MFCPCFWQVFVVHNNNSSDDKKIEEDIDSGVSDMEETGNDDETAPARQLGSIIEVQAGESAHCTDHHGFTITVQRRLCQTPLYNHFDNKVKYNGALFPIRYQANNLLSIIFRDRACLEVV